MSDYVTLLGAEDIRSAGGAIRSAAEQMNQAAGSLDFTATNFLRQFGELVERLERAVEVISTLETKP